MTPEEYVEKRIREAGTPDDQVDAIKKIILAKSFHDLDATAVAEMEELVGE